VANTIGDVIINSSGTMSFNPHCPSFDGQYQHIDTYTMKDQVGLDTMRTLLEQLEETVKDGNGEALKGKERKELKVSERYNEDDADVTIVSSDEVVFRVHSFLLLRAS